MKPKIKQSRVLALVCGLLIAPHYFSQTPRTVISEKWEFGNSNNPVFYKAKSKTDDQNNVYITGATLNSQNNRDLIVQKLNESGTLIWENTLNGSANLNDFGTDVYVDDNYDVYVTGSINRLGTQQDLVIIKYKSDGSLDWTYYYNSTDSTDNESGSALIEDNGHLFVTGVNITTNTQSDYLTIALNANDGTEIWSNQYNYLDLNEVAVNIGILNSKLVVTGASQISLAPQMKWELATLTYDLNNGSQLDENRTTGNATQGVDEVHDMIIDNNNDIYIVGGVVNQSTGYDIAVYKLDTDLNIVWEHFFDEYGLDDVGYGIKLDNAGNIYLTGYSTKNNEGKNIFVKKLDSNGDAIWTRELKGQANLDDVGIQLSIFNETTIYITGYIKNSIYSDFIVSGFSDNGEMLNSIEYDGNDHLDDTPTSIAIDVDGNIVVTGQSYSGSTFRTTTLKYEIYNRSMDFYSDSTGPLTIKNNVIVRFAKDAVNISPYENKNVRASQISTFLKPATISQLSAKTGFNWENLTAYRVHTKFGPEDSLSITRYGDTISTFDFWTALCIETPKGYNEKIIVDSLSTLEGIVITSAENCIYIPSSLPNDTYINTQLSLFPNTTYPNADIDVEGAWNYEVGNENIKVGVVDYLVDYFHEDFGDGTFAGSKVKGYDCVLNQGISVFPMQPTKSHGTAVGGIIGALRNNNTGVAGIAGGDMSNLNKGVQLYSLVIFNYNSTADAADVVEAITLGNLQTTSGNGFGLHIQNLSFGSTQPNGELNNTLKEGFRNGCAYSAARGNRGHFDNAVEYPACYVVTKPDGSKNDYAMMGVIASGTDGSRKSNGNGGNLPDTWGSSYGVICSPSPCTSCTVDFMAPGTNELVTTTLTSAATPISYSSCAISNDVDYGCFNGTSAAAPHVTGVAALMMSKHQPSNGYPNILISEDLEHILEKTAGNQTLTYSVQSGYGLIDARLAVEQVSDPYYVKHVVVPVNTPLTDLGLVEQGAEQTVSPNIYGVPAGLYDYAKKYRCYWNMTETLPPGHNIIDYWKVEAMTQLGKTNVYSPSFGTTATNIENENLTVNIGGNTSSIYGMTYIYELTNYSGQKYWYPASPENMKYVYSLHVLKQPDASVDELTNENVSIYPNPTNNEISIKFDQFMDHEYTVEIVDAVGKTVFSKLIIPNSAENIVVSQLKSGVYFCKIHFENHTLTKTFIKSE